jgi:PAS domain S-box-containing protein
MHLPEPPRAKGEIPADILPPVSFPMSITASSDILLLFAAVGFVFLFLGVFITLLVLHVRRDRVMLPSDVASQAAVTILPDPYLDNVLQQMTRAMREKDGGEMVPPTYLDPQTPSGQLGIAYNEMLLDLRKQKQVEKSQTDAAQKIQWFADTIQEGVVVIQDGLIQYVNEALATLFGYQTDELVGMAYQSLCHQAELARIDSRIADVRDAEFAQVQIHLRARRQDGKLLLVDVKGSLATEDDGCLFWGTVVDITRQKRDEMALTRSRLRAKRQKKGLQVLLQSMERSLRLPVNDLVQISRELQAGEAQAAGAVHRDQLRQLHLRAEYLRALLDDVRLLTMLQAGEATAAPGRFLLPPLVTAVVAATRPLAAENHNQLRLEMDSVAEIVNDRSKVQRILQILLEQTAVFAAYRQITLHVESLAGGGVQFVLRDRPLPSPPVQNDGVDLPVDDLENQKYNGKELGLALCHQYCVLINGEMTGARGHENASYTITLPDHVLAEKNVVLEETSHG